MINQRVFQKASLLLLGAAFLFTSCKKDDPIMEDSKPAGTPYPLSGHYVWKFKVGNFDQESHLVCYTDSIGYSMIGPVYSTNYMMIQKEYSEENGQKRWIGVGKGGSIPKDGKFFVLFFKDIESSSVVVYKKEFDTEAAARQFAQPADDDTQDYGWNTYVKK